VPTNRIQNTHGQVQPVEQSYDVRLIEIWVFEHGEQRFLGAITQEGLQIIA
jgi:hypothetical protein